MSGWRSTGMRLNVNQDRVNYPAYLILLSLFLYGIAVPTLSLLSLVMIVPIILFFKKKEITVDFVYDVTLVFLFGVLYYLISIIHSVYEDTDWFQDKLFFLIGNFCIAYFLGYILAQNYRGIDLTIAAAGSGFIVLALLSLLQFVSTNHFTLETGAYITERAVPSFWNGMRINGPILGIYLSLGICLLSLFFKKLNPLMWIGVCLIVGSSLYGNLLLQNRSPIYAGILTLGISLMLFLYSRARSRNLWIVLCFLPTILVTLYYFMDKEWIYPLFDSPIWTRFKEEGLNTPRYQLWMKGIWGLLEHPLGGAKTDFSPYDFAHNLWLDVGWYSGILPVLILLWVQLRHIKSLLQLIMRHPDQAFGAIGMSVSFFVGMMVEPTLIGSYTYMTLFFFFIGYVKSFVKDIESS